MSLPLFKKKKESSNVCIKWQYTPFYYELAYRIISLKCV
jgi:hypothetical protein